MDAFWKRYEECVHSYLPDWQYDRAGTETEAALLTVAAELLADSRRLLDRLPEKHEREFLRPWDTGPQQAGPAHAFAVLTSPNGQLVPAGSEFYLSGDGTRLWKTVDPVHAEPAKLAAQAFTSASRQMWLTAPLPEPDHPVSLFDLHGDNLRRCEARFTHPDAFASRQGCEVQLKFPDADQSIFDCLAGEADTAWQIVQGGLEIPVPTPVCEERSLSFCLPAAPDATSLLARLRPGCRAPEGRLGKVLVATRREDLPVSIAFQNDGTACALKQWLPFGDKPELWRYCSLACPDALALRGAEIKMAFSSAMRVREELLPATGQETGFRPVMRHLPTPPAPPQDVYADAVEWEYWNGAAWLPIPGADRYNGCFGSRGSEGAVRLEAQFTWPEDAARCEVQGIGAHWLRWRVQRADSTGWLPCRYHAPEVSGVCFSAALEDAPVLVESRVDVCGGLTQPADPQAPLFTPILPEHDAWWLGFDQPPDGGTRQLYLSIQGRSQGGRLTAWEPGLSGELRQIALIDGTDGLSHSGVLDLSDIRGGLSFKFGAECWWLCLQDESDALGGARSRPKLAQVVCGAAHIQSLGADLCAADETLSPFRGGTLSGVCLTEAYGGCAEETDLENLHRLRAERHDLGRIVSPLDLNELVCRSLRDVARTRCVRDGDTLTVCVLMRDVSNHAAALALRGPEIERLLERLGPLAALGLKYRICKPCFYTLHVTAWVRMGEQSFSEVGPILTDTLRRFLDPVTGHFSRNGWRIGELPSAAQLRTVIRKAAPGTVLTELLITAVGPDSHELDVSQVSDPFALPLSGEHTIRAV